MAAHMAPMIVIPSLISIVHGFNALLPADRRILSPEAREKLPRGTIIIDADDCHAVADGNDGFHDVGLVGTFPGDESVVLPAYVIAGPGLPTLLPGGAAILSSQHHVDGVRYEFYAIDTAGNLFRWTALDDLYELFAWETAGQVGEASPVFPITAWQ